MTDRIRVRVIDAAARKFYLFRWSQVDPASGTPKVLTRSNVDGVKVPRFTRLIDPQRISTALMQAIDTGREEIYIPRFTLRSLALLRASLSPRWMEKTVELTGMHQSFYSSRTID